MGKTRKKPPQGETKAQRFRRVVEPRVGKALKAIRLVGNVKGSAYACDDSQIARIEGTLQEAVNHAVENLHDRADSADRFSL